MLQMDNIVYIIIGASFGLVLLLLLAWCRFRRRPQPKQMDFAPGIPEVVVEHQTPNRTPYKRNRRHSPGTESVEASVVSPRRSPSPTGEYSRSIYSDASSVSENGVENAASGTLFLDSTSTKAKMRLKQLWTTPLMVLQLDTSERFNQKLSDLALQLYYGFEPRAHKYGDFSSKTNRFFVYQKEQSELPESQQDERFRVLMHSREFNELQRMLYECHLEYLRSAGNSEEFINSHPFEKLHCWATVQVDGSGHTQHSHPDAVVSGCYYSMVPDSGCGQVVFDDPRGPRHPFDSTYSVTPKVGALVLFPSWLLHTVMPTSSHEPRVSWAFNVIGEWEEFIGGNSPK